MTEPHSLHEQSVGEHRSTACEYWAERDERLRLNWCRDEQGWLHNRVKDLERQLESRSIALAGALALSALLGSYVVTSLHDSEEPTVDVLLARSPDAPRAVPSSAAVVEQPWQLRRSQASVLGEERIEAIAVLHFDASRTKSPTEHLSGLFTGSSEAMKLEVTPWRELEDGGSKGVARECSPGSPEIVVNASLNQDESSAAPANERFRYIAADFVNLRAAPNHSAEVLSVLAQGDVVRRTGRDLGWLQVEYDAGTTRTVTGWVYSSYLRRVEASSSQLDLEHNGPLAPPIPSFVVRSAAQNRHGPQQIASDLDRQLDRL
jgi:hypothetical protein